MNSTKITSSDIKWSNERETYYAEFVEEQDVEGYTVVGTELEIEAGDPILEGEIENYD